jgi:hypothetical protein
MVKKSIKKNKQKLSKESKKINKINKKKVRQLLVKPHYNEEYMKNKEGDYFDEKHYNLVIKDDCDCYYYDENNDKKLLFKFRKKVIPEKLCNIGLENLKKAAQKTHDNRGASAGKIDMKKMPLYANDPKLLVGRNKFRVKEYISKYTGKVVKNSLGNISQSNIIGYYDKRDRNLGANAPMCRTTAFTSQQVEKWDKVIPLIIHIDRLFKKLIPKNHKIQLKQAQASKNFVIANTAYSTVTINYNWRTAMHKDDGDLKDGFGNLVILEEGKYDGGYLGFPRYKACIDVRHGDFLAMDVHEWHCNTKITPKTKDYTRLSMVSYLREKMIKCKDN